MHVRVVVEIVGAHEKIFTHHPQPTATTVARPHGQHHTRQQQASSQQEQRAAGRQEQQATTEPPTTNTSTTRGQGRAKLGTRRASSKEEQ